MSSSIESKKVSSSTSTQTKRRNANTVLSLQQFAFSKSKGTRRAIEKYRQKRQNEFNHRAGLVRGYRRALKKEGFDHKQKIGNDEDTNNNRKRKIDRLENDETTSDYDNSKTPLVISKDSSNDILIRNGKSEGKRPKFDPFAKSRAKAKRHKEAKVQHNENIQRQLKIKEERLKERKKRSKVMSKRTRRGQPIMKNVIGAMLGKLQEESKQEKET